MPCLLLRARLVLPVSQPPIANGAVVITGEHIAAVGKWKALRTEWACPSLDLGEVMLLPGLVNAHCHLDYTEMAGEFTTPRCFTDWIKLITTTKSQWGYSEFAESWLKGAKMLVRTGTTTVGDIENLALLLPEVWQATPLRIISFLEMTGVKSRRKPKTILDETVGFLRSLPAGRCRAGLSPHAPYSTVPELIRLSAQTAHSEGWPITIHVSESGEEFEMFMRGKGGMFDWLKRNERDMSDCGLGSPIRHLERCRALSSNLLAVHVNHLARGDAALLARRKVSVAHCPRSHAFFRHEPFPWRSLRRAGVNLCLGTDSLASMYKPRRHDIELDLFEEMRLFARVHNNARPRTVLRMTTVNAACALGMKREVGQISKNAFADLIALPFSGKSSRAYDAVLSHTGPVLASMIDGQWAIAPDEIQAGPPREK